MGYSIPRTYRKDIVFGPEEFDVTRVLSGPQEQS